MQIFICNFTKKIFLSAEEINFIEIKVNAEYLQKFCRCDKTFRSDAKKKPP